VINTNARLLHGAHTGHLLDCMPSASILPGHRQACGQGGASWSRTHAAAAEQDPSLNSQAGVIDAEQSRSAPAARLWPGWRPWRPPAAPARRAAARRRRPPPAARQRRARAAAGSARATTPTGHLAPGCCGPPPARAPVLVSAMKKVVEDWGCFEHFQQCLSPSHWQRDLSGEDMQERTRARVRASRRASARPGPRAGQGRAGSSCTMNSANGSSSTPSHSQRSSVQKYGPQPARSSRCSSAVAAASPARAARRSARLGRSCCCTGPCRHVGTGIKMVCLQASLHLRPQRCGNGSEL